VQGRGTHPGLFLQPGVIDKFLQAANGNAHPACARDISLDNLVGDIVQLFVLGIEKDVQVEEIDPVSRSNERCGFLGLVQPHWQGYC